MSSSVRVAVVSVLLIMGIVASSREAAAQAGVGAGPLTGSLTDIEPTSGVFRLGRVRLAPGLSIPEIGWDDNVFQEDASQTPDEDYMASFGPDASAYTRLRFVRLSAFGGTTITRYRKFSSEDSIGYAWRGRADFLLSRVRPFVAGGRTKSRNRPNGEIDVRPDRVQEEFSGGLAFDVWARSVFYASAFKATNKFENSVQDGIDLAETLTRDSYNVQGGLRTDLTPLLSMQLFASYQEDKFRNLPIRDGVSKGGSAVFRVAPEAAFTGQITVSYSDTLYSDPKLRSYKGVSGNVALAYSFLETGRLTLIGQRLLDYSLDEAEGYFVENSATLSYTHRLFGKVDAQLRGGRAAFDYSARSDIPTHVDTLDTLGGSLGYNLRNRTRVAVNYEYSRRRSPAFEDRNYIRRRAYLSWTFAI